LSEIETTEETAIASETEAETIQPTSQTDREFDSLRSDLEIAQSNLQRETRETPTVQRREDLPETRDRQPAPQSEDPSTTSTTTSQPLPDSSEPTVAQLLSDRDTDPSAPDVLDNLIQLQPLSDTTPLTPTVRHSSPSKTTSPPDLQPQADRTSNSADVPPAWSSINDLLGQVQASDRPSSKVQPPTDSHSQESIDPIFPPPRQSTTVQRQTDSQSTELVFTPQGFRRTAVKPQPQVVQKQDRPRISRQDTEPKTVSRPNQTHPSDLEDTQAFEHLAREIYQILRQRLEIERERHGSNYSGRSLW
jgi:epidermal growth factor receptor substrate 15